METLFAPAERDTADDVRRTFDALKASVPYDAILDLMPTMSLIVNGRRQVLFANAAALSALGLKPSEAVGSRPGELLGCVHAFETTGGCGTSEACRVCGAVNTIVEAIRTRARVESECRITLRRDGKSDSLDLLVTAVPIGGTPGNFLMVTMNDISDKKRREILERIFFHDLMNGLSSLQSGLFLINAEFGGMASEHDYLPRVASVMESLIDEVRQQREILTMENGDLETELIEFDLGKLAREIVRHAEIADYAGGKRIVLRDGRLNPLAFSDPILLRRVILNMLKNALEASAPGEEVLLELEAERGRTRISVRNPAFIPREHQLQVFQRSFSTKGRGRGLGTYGMRMLTERYLGGRIEFSSGEGAGTTFRAILPDRLAP